MNRRSFLQLIGGALIGAVAAAVPGIRQQDDEEVNEDSRIKYIWAGGYFSDDYGVTWQKNYSGVWTEPWKDGDWATTTAATTNYSNEFEYIEFR
jgi:hypothetical protein